MKHGFIKVAAATPRVTVADCKANGEEILRAIREMEKELGISYPTVRARDVFWTVRGRSFFISLRRQRRQMH